jgi:mono/diheme cytochrome c family protein
MAAATTILLLSGIGCRQDMHDEPKFFPQRGTDFYADGRSVRPQVAETVARNQLHADTYFYTGLVSGKEGDALPFPVTMKVLARGQERYNVYCTPCHSRVGNGEGMIVQRGYAQAGDFQGSRLRAAPLGHFFNVMTNGHGAMPDYAAQIAPVDRWAIAAYIRALQLSQNAQRSDVPAGAEVKPLRVIATSEGLPESFAGEWAMPATAIGAGGATPSSPQTSPDPAASAPAGKSALAVPAKTVDTVAQAKTGQALYAKNCQVCHGANLAGHPPTFPSLVHVVDRIGAAHVRHNVHDGAPPMPAFPSLSPAELDDLVVYLSNPSKAGPLAPSGN